MKKIDSDNFLTLVKNYINCNLKQTNYALPMLKGYLMKRPLGKSTKKDYFFDFISHDTNNSIKCIFSKENKESNINIDFYKPFEVHITKYNFDYLTYEKNNVLDYNFVLYVESFELLKEKKDVLEKNNMYPENLNRVTEIFDNLNALFHHYIQGYLSDYTKIYTESNLSANNFINKNFENDKSESILKILQVNFNTSKEAVLLKTKIGISESTYPKYLYNSNYEIEKYMNSQNWKKMFSNSSTITNKIKTENKEMFTPVSVDIKEYPNMKKFTEEKNKFLNNKKKRDFYKEDEIKNLPAKVQKYVEFYQDINNNIGRSLVEKYQLYRKYIENIKSE
jgi:hypothetical protein